LLYDPGYLPGLGAAPPMMIFIFGAIVYDEPDPGRGLAGLVATEQPFVFGRIVYKLLLCWQGRKMVERITDGIVLELDHTFVCFLQINVVHVLKVRSYFFERLFFNLF
jgi:hypothetical protein